MCRSPENTLPSVGDLVHSISADISEASPQLLEDLLPQIKHAKETVRYILQHPLQRANTRAAPVCQEDGQVLGCELELLAQCTGRYQLSQPVDADTGMTGAIEPCSDLHMAAVWHHCLQAGVQTCLVSKQMSVGTRLWPA